MAENQVDGKRTAGAGVGESWLGRAAKLKKDAEGGIADGWNALKSEAAARVESAKKTAGKGGELVRQVYEKGADVAAEGISRVAGKPAGEAFRSAAAAAEKPVQELVKYDAGMVEGFIKGAGRMVGDVVELAGRSYTANQAMYKTAYDLAVNDKFRADALKETKQAGERAMRAVADAGTFALQHPVKAAGAVMAAKNEMDKKIAGAIAGEAEKFYNGAVEANKKGNLSGYLGNATGETAAIAASFFIGAGEANAVSKVAKGASMLERGEATAGVLTRGSEVLAQNAGRAEQAGETLAVNADRALNGAAKAGRSGETGAADSAAKIVFTDTANTVVDKAVGTNAGKLIADSPVGSAFYRSLQYRGTNVKMVSDPAMKEVGFWAGKGLNEVEVNLLRCRSAKDAASTIVHEATHQRRAYKGLLQKNRYEEYLAFRNEQWFERGARPTLSERRAIWESVNDLYPELPVGRNPFGAGK